MVERPWIDGKLEDRATGVIGSDDVAVGEHEAQKRSGFGVGGKGDRHDCHDST
jgi:hypothetical protein